MNFIIFYSCVPNASLSFAFPRGEPELKDIINKALSAIPPSEVLRLTEKLD